MKTNSFIIFAHARSGSTSLVRLLNLREDLILFNFEAFNPNWDLPKNLSSIFGSCSEQISLFGKSTQVTSFKSPNNFDQYLRFLFSMYDGFKVLWCQLTCENSMKLISRKNLKVIFLYRESALETAISNMLAIQTGVWETHHKRLKGFGDKNYLKCDIDYKYLENTCQYLKRAREHYQLFLKEHNVDHIEITYESLFGHDLDFSSKISRLNDVLNFLGKKQININLFNKIIEKNNHWSCFSHYFNSDERSSKLLNLLSVKNTKVLNDKIVNKILSLESICELKMKYG